MTLQQEVTDFIRVALEEVTEGTETTVTVPGRSVGDLVIDTAGWHAVVKITEMWRTTVPPHPDDPADFGLTAQMTAQDAEQS